MRNYEGEICIQFDEFFKWVNDNYLPDTGDEVLLGVPQVARDGSAITVSYAGSNECNPGSWATPPKALEEWKAHSATGNSKSKKKGEE